MRDYIELKEQYPTVSIGEYTFMVNGIPVYPDPSLLGDSGLTITQVSNFAELLHTYKNIQQIDLDYTARLAFGRSYSNPSIPFTKSKMLTLINFADSNGNSIQFTRKMAAQKLNIPVDRLNASFNTWSDFASQVNKGSTSSLCKPGTRLMFADYTTRMAKGTFGPGSTWSKPRRLFGFFGLGLFAAGAVVTGGVQAVRSARANHRRGY